MYSSGPVTGNRFNFRCFTPRSVSRLIGQFFEDGPLYIVKDDRPYEDTVNNPLLQLITIQSTRRLELTWTTEPDEIVHYSWSFGSTNSTVLAPPYLTTNHSGIVPRQQVFYYVLPCTGIDPHTLTGTVNLNYTITRNTTATNDNLTKNGETPWNMLFVVHLATRVNCVLLAPTKEVVPTNATVAAPAKSSGSEPLWVIGVVFALVIILGLLVFVGIRRKLVKVKVLERQLTMLQEAQESGSVRYIDVNSNYSGSISGSMTYKDTLSMRMRNASRKARHPTELVAELKENWFEVLSDCIIEMNQIKFEDQLGKGAFGFVYKGKLASQADPGVEETVALKTMKSFEGFDDISRFLSEGIVMKDFHHPNVMGLMGVSFPENDPPVIVLPFMANGDLHAFLKKRRGSVSAMDALDDAMISTSQLMQFILNIVHGMDYLSAQKFVHRDLAARNCMLDADLVVKIGDFGLAKEMHEDLYYRMGTPTKLPVKWMAIESLNDQIFTTQTDVWAFGVTMWEIWSMGKQPYPGVANHELMNHLLKGHRLQQPEGCTDELFEVMASCWEEDSHNRPTFSQLVMMLERLESGRYIKQDEPDGYENFSPTHEVSNQNWFGGEDHIYEQDKCKPLSIRQPSKDMIEHSVTLGDASPYTKLLHAGEETSGVKMSRQIQSPAIQVDKSRDQMLSNDSSNGATMLSGEEKGAEYQKMALNPQSLLRLNSNDGGTMVSSVGSQQHAQDDEVGDKGEYLSMSLKSNRNIKDEEPSPRMNSDSVFSDDEHGGDYLKMALTPKQFKVLNGDTVFSNDEHGGNYLKMALTSEQSNVPSSDTMIPDDEHGGNYVKMALTPKQSNVPSGDTVFPDDEHGGNYLKMALTPKQTKVPSEHAFSSVSSQQSAEYDDEEDNMEDCVKMGFKSSQDLEQSGGDRQLSDEENGGNYLRMELTPKQSKKQSPSSGSCQQDGEDTNLKYTKMSVKSNTSFERPYQYHLAPPSDSAEDEEYLKMSLKGKGNSSAMEGYVKMMPKPSVASNGVAGPLAIDLGTDEIDL
jgi:serine/threonine protein kinase